jgi:flagellar motility protein MotE (MotC chaperone)
MRNFAAIVVVGLAAVGAFLTLAGAGEPGSEGESKIVSQAGRAKAGAKAMEGGSDPAKAETAAAADSAPASGGGSKSAPSACIADSAAIDDLKRGHDELEARRKELDARDADLKARETALGEEMKKLEQARDDLSKSVAARAKENDEKVTKVVETLETMNPKAASKLLSDIDETLAVASIARISTPKLAKIMNVMETGHSSRLTEILAGVVHARKTAASAAGESQSAKGGEEHDGQHNEQSSNRSSRSAVDQPQDPARKPGSVQGKGPGAG